MFAEKITTTYIKELSNLNDFQCEVEPDLFINKTIKLNNKDKICFIYCSYQELEDKNKFLRVCNELEEMDREISINRKALSLLLDNEYKLKVYEDPGENNTLTEEEVNLLIEDIHTWTNIQLNSNGELLKVQSSSYNNTKNKDKKCSNSERDFIKNESKIYRVDSISGETKFINTGYPRIRNGFQNSSKHYNKDLIKTVYDDLDKVLTKVYNKDINNARLFVKIRMHPSIALDDSSILPDLRGNVNYQMFLEVSKDTHQNFNDILYFEDGTISKTPYSYIKANSKQYNVRKRKNEN